MAIAKLNQAHKRFILKQVAAFNCSPEAIRTLLTDKKQGGEFGFEPVKISNQRLSVIINKLPEDELDAERALYLADFSDTPFAFKKNRVVELMKLYYSLNPTKVDSSSKEKIPVNEKHVLAQAKILSDIKSEMGEDADRLARSQAGNVTVNVTIAEREQLEQKRTTNLKKGLASIDRFIPSDN